MLNSIGTFTWFVVSPNEAKRLSLNPAIAYVIFASNSSRLTASTVAQTKWDSATVAAMIGAVHHFLLDVWQNRYS
jgi:hypothetical protein